mmetsp:Transcript_910/g.1978  ORF Transcript_910/g.1978 Transcript_910/m.1978 type:complete len:144 (+) Transcript_910:1565-1996(+)
MALLWESRECSDGREQNSPGWTPPRRCTISYSTNRKYMIELARSFLAVGKKKFLISSSDATESIVLLSVPLICHPPMYYAEGGWMITGIYSKRFFSLVTHWAMKPVELYYGQQLTRSCLPNHGTAVLIMDRECIRSKSEISIS